jgi:peptidoglycan/LPS O-acetylase OafA/YrhL
MNTTNIGMTVSSVKYESKKLYKLEAVRGFAAIYTAAGHVFSNNFIVAGHNFSILLKFGQEAVILFFLLSGFVIQYSFSLSKDKSFGLYFTKRFLRIYIPLIAVFILNYLLFISKYSNIPVSSWNLVGNLLMLQDVFKPNVICGCFLGNLPLWSLSYEWWFYILFYVVTMKVRKYDSKIVYLVGIISAASYIVYPNFFNRELMYFVIWWVGADMARAYLANNDITFTSMTSQLVTIALIALILALNVKINYTPAATFGVSPFIELRHFAFALVAIAGAILWQKLRWIGFNQTIGLFTFIAPISFGIYISHWFLIAHAEYLDGVINNVYIKYTTYIAVCVTFSYLIERIIYVHLSKMIMKKLFPK